MKIYYKPETLTLNHDSRVKKPIIMTHGKLVILGEQIEARSGGWGKGSIPHGIYVLSDPTQLPDNDQNNSYKCQVFPWIIRLTPMFYLPDRNGFLIHPDGGIPGTKGCLSPIEKDMYVWGLLTDLMKKEEVGLYVL